MKMFGEGRVSWCFAASCIWSGARLKSANIDIEFTLIMYICIFDHTAKGSRNKSLNSILVLLKHSDPKFQGLPVDRWDLLWMSSSCSAPCIATYIYIYVYINIDQNGSHHLQGRHPINLKTGCKCACGKSKWQIGKDTINEKCEIFLANVPRSGSAISYIHLPLHLMMPQLKTRISDWEKSHLLSPRKPCKSDSIWVFSLCVKSSLPTRRSPLTTHTASVWRNMRWSVMELRSSWGEVVHIDGTLRHLLVGGWTNPSEKSDRQNGWK